MQAASASGSASTVRRIGAGVAAPRRWPAHTAAPRAAGNSAQVVVAAAELQPGTRVRVKVPLKVWHVGKYKDGLDLQGMEGVLQANVALWKGQVLSATHPFKVLFNPKNPENPEGKPLKVFAHLVRPLPTCPALPCLPVGRGARGWAGP